MRLGHVRDRRKPLDVEWLRVRHVHGVAGPQEAPVGLLGGAAHTTAPIDMRTVTTPCRVRMQGNP